MKISEKYAHKPKLWRVVCELSKFKEKEPEKALNLLLAIAGPMLKEGGHDEQ